jgi:hypothetical protein
MSERKDEEAEALAAYETFRKLCDKEPTLVQWAAYCEQKHWGAEDKPTLH